MVDVENPTGFEQFEKMYESLATLADSPEPEQEENARALLLSSINSLSEIRADIRKYFHKASWVRGRQPEEMQSGLNTLLEYLTRSQHLYARMLPKIETKPVFKDVCPLIVDMIEKLEQDLEDFAEIPDFV